MKILAIEFSSRQRSVAVVVDGRALGVASEQADRATRAVELIEQALAGARLEREQIDCLAVGLGPGSYTGIRAAIALAQGWQLGRPIKLLGIGSVECLAAAAQGRGWNGRVNFAVDAQRNELYLAGYEIGPEHRREVAPLKLAALDEAQARSAAGEILAGPDVTRWFPNGRILFPEASVLGQLATDRTDFVTGEALEPIYLREINFVKTPAHRTQSAG